MQVACRDRVIGTHTSAVSTPTATLGLATLIDQAITSASTVGVFGLVFALVAGLGWMTNFRDALSVQWGHDQHPLTPYLRRLGPTWPR